MSVNKKYSKVYSECALYKSKLFTPSLNYSHLSKSKLFTPMKEELERDIDVKEVLDVMNHLPVGKSPGPDRIPNRLLII